MVRQTNKMVCYTEQNGSIVQSFMAEFYGTSSDTKPTSGILNGSAFLEVDTGKIFLFNESTSSWAELQ